VPSLSFQDVFSSSSWRVLRWRLSSSFQPFAFDWHEEIDSLVSHLLTKRTETKSDSFHERAGSVCLLVGAGGWLGTHLLTALKFER
jgi:hypothetical protein